MNSSHSSLFRSWARYIAVGACLVAFIAITATSRADAPKAQYDTASICGVARDLKTGLYWRRDSMCKLSYENPTTHENTAVKYCTDMGPTWRIPTINELYSIVDTTRTNPAIDPFVFPNTIPNAYVSSTANAPTNHLTVVFDTGGGDGASNIQDSCVRCVSSVKP